MLLSQTVVLTNFTNIDDPLVTQILPKKAE